MRFLITGGTGFIGSRLALHLNDDGARVRVFGQTNTAAEEENRRRLEEEGVEVGLGSVTDPGVVREQFDEVDVVFHLAAVQHEMDVSDDYYREVNVEGTKNVLDASARSSVARFVHASTVSVYGVESTNGATIDETTPPSPDDVYGRTKLEAERLALSYSDRLPVAVARIPEAYGPGDRRLLKLFRTVDRGLFFIVGPGENLHHPIYVADLVRGLQAAGTVPGAVNEVFLLTGKESVTTAEMAETVADVLEEPPPRVRLPMAPVVALAALMEKTLRPLGVQPPLHRRRLNFFRRSLRLCGAKARKLLGFCPQVGFREGARRTAEWYRSRDLL